jgi:hypothetical protein
MDPATIALIAQFAIQFGIPAGRALVALFSIKDPTPADWEKVFLLAEQSYKEQVPDSKLP